MDDLATILQDTSSQIWHVSQPPATFGHFGATYHIVVTCCFYEKSMQMLKQQVPQNQSATKT